MEEVRISCRIMTSAIDRAMCAMTLEEVDEPFDMSVLPEFCSSESNVLSLIGRVLNPDRQKMVGLISDLPRK